MTDTDLLSIVQIVARAVEMCGVTVIVAGILWSGAMFPREWRRMEGKEAYQCLRANIGRSILLGLELLVAADIINTVAIEPTLDSLAVLGGIVLIRTFLSFALEAEIEGRWPWQADARRKGGQHPAGRNGGETQSVVQTSGQEKET